MPDLFAAMNHLTGISQAKLQAIWDQVKDNQVRLDGCPGPHDFRAIPGNDRRERCTKCGGELNILNVIYYTRGLEHGRKEASHA
jgi:hypothetical protein